MLVVRKEEVDATLWPVLITGTVIESLLSTDTAFDLGQDVIQTGEVVLPCHHRPFAPVKQDSPEYWLYAGIHRGTEVYFDRQALLDSNATDGMIERFSLGELTAGIAEVVPDVDSRTTGRHRSEVGSENQEEEIQLFYGPFASKAVGMRRSRGRSHTPGALNRTPDIARWNTS